MTSSAKVPWEDEAARFIDEVQREMHGDREDLTPEEMWAVDRRAMERLSKHVHQLVAEGKATPGGMRL